MATKKVTIKNYKKAEYKTKLTVYEYNDIISTTVEGTIDLYDKGIYGFNAFTFYTALVSVCTNIDMEVTDPDAKIKLFDETDVIERIKSSIGETAYNHIVNEIDMGIKYRISTNPETKTLLSELGKFIANLSKISENVTDADLAELTTKIKETLVSNQVS